MDTQLQIKIANNIRNNTKTDVGGSALSPRYQPQVKREERAIPTSFGETRVLIYRPKNNESATLPVFVNLHGGGFILGKPEMDDSWCGLITERADCVVVSIDYRLAPENKFPIALNECYEIVEWIHKHPEELSINPLKIAVGGHSAGGNLAASICLLNKQRGNKLPIIYQIIDYAPLDLDTDPALKPHFKEALPINLARTFNALYFENKEHARNPLASPLFAESLDNLPEALIITAELDSLAAEAESYAEKLKQAGVKVTYKQYKGVPHGFTHNGDLIIAEDAWYLMSDKLRGVFSSF